MSDRSIQVTASGRRSADPDTALVRVSVVASAADAMIARQQLAEGTSKMRTALTEDSATDDQLRTDNYTIRQDSPRHGPHGPADSSGDDQPTQTAVQTFEITTDPGRVGDVIDTAVTNGANRIENIQFTLSTETRQRLRTSALEDAMTVAREQAETIAERAELSIEGVRTVQTGVNRNPPNQKLAFDTSDQGASTAIDTPAVAVTVHISVTYDVTEER